MFPSDYGRSGKLRVWDSPVTVHIWRKIKLEVYFPSAMKEENKRAEFVC
jgi:hypothetical protein